MFNKNDLLALQGHAGETLISILAPMEKIFPSSDVNRILIKNQLKDIERQLKTTSNKGNGLLDKLHKLESEIDYEHTQDGIALFVSDEVAMVQHLPFKPEAAVYIDSTFHTRNLLQGIYKTINYYILLLSAEHTKLFYGWGKNLLEVENNDWPMRYSGPKRTEPLTRTLRTDVEYEELEDIRIYLRTVEEKLYERIYQERIPLFLLGEEEYISFIKDQKSGKYVMGSVAENLSHQNKNELLERAWPMIEAYKEQQVSQNLEALEEAIGYRKYAGGAEEVWRAAYQGQVLTLMVEENFHSKGRINNEDVLRLELVPSHFSDPDLQQDIVDTIIEKVTEMDGNVIFVKDGQLEKHGRIAALLRFSL